MQEYLLNITPQTHVRATQDDIKGFRIFGSLHGRELTTEEQDKLDELIVCYPGLYRRFLMLVRYNEYKRRLTAESILKGFWLRDAGMEITFYLPVSPSWRKGKKDKYHMQPHQFKPDIDNLEKALFDILRPQQDHAIWNLKEMEKLWINEPQGAIRIICHDMPQREEKDWRQLKLKFRYTVTARKPRKR